MATMTYPAYDGYDGFGRISRRQSMSYTPSMGYQYGHQPMYGDGMMSPMGAEYPTHPSYPPYTPQAATIPVSHRLTGPSYDDLAVRDGYYDGVPGSAGSHGWPRQRRRSTVSFSSRPSLDLRLPSSERIKFKRKGSFMAGVTLAEAQNHVRLSSNDAYSAHDLHADRRGTILLRIKWVGYSSVTYEIPLDTYDGRISLQTLARRISRACVHYLQANIVPVPWDRVKLHHLEEVAYGTWQPMLSS